MRTNACNVLKFVVERSFQQSRAPVTKAAPTFEDLTIDDNLSEQQRVVRYTKSSIGLQRLCIGSSYLSMVDNGYNVYS
jgi:hypothetical protein